MNLRDDWIGRYFGRNPVWAALSIHSVRGVPVQSGVRLVRVNYLSDDWLHFRTDLRLPLGGHYSVGFRLTLEGSKLILTGEVAWVKEEAETYLYGVRLLPDKGGPDGRMTKPVYEPPASRSWKQHIHEAYRKMMAFFRYEMERKIDLWH